jgi:hypothetical protein
MTQNKSTPIGVLFLFASVEDLLAATCATAVHDEEPGQDIADITATATHQEKDEDVVIATTATVCSTVCKKVHYVTSLFGFYFTLRNSQILCSWYYSR